jgi:putative ABC transport system permease protein
MIGLYGVIAFSVSRRSREIGVRIALGARPGEVIKLFLKQAMPIVLAGTLVGFAGALAATRALRSLLIGVAPTDPASWGVAGALLVIVALAATWWPARRATKVDPMVALRNE